MSTLQLRAPTPLEYFAALVAEDDGFALFEAAVATAQDEYPALDTQAVLDEVDALGARLKARLPADAPPMHRLRALNRYFFNELGFGGNVNDYFDRRNSYLNDVLSTRRGIPITLALLYAELAGQLGRSGKDAAPALAQEIARGAVGGSIVAAEAAGPYVNFRLDPAAVSTSTGRASASASA